ncbi:PQQ-binding-like beta-propeller repeat protein [candidate division KSB1 bacterium]|nr:PQQ-binding-like beta-propeller repeat protein [candidate division KSB1 bacterium]NIR71763.1 PQQ-binding-like beta-propeller repeat protein [candidate division KSB1 bacterium]NIS24919.1 PQQ-binding-like beta-propeller repeat protein [candidate division KSB1 bacterium]NIT71795.1 PQQ-binding-like beta-propeller repeat protein [candidate division KSB1 bacterium]NIU25533.1 PQQ-binding-like beta-propeller repeat protein [candidate division KSB1 bacterium]
MRLRIFISVFLLFNLSVLPLFSQDSDSQGVNWPMFRGPGATGISEGSSTPVRWNMAEDENIKWKTAISGLGHSSPVIWGDRIYLTTAISGKDEPYLKVGLYGNIEPVKDDTEHTWKLFCLDKHSGAILWEKTALKAVPRIKRHMKSTHANSTPATNGTYLVTFLGSEGLFCYDMDGNELWRKDFGPLDAGYFRVPAAQWGFASSPVIYEDRVIVQCDVQENSFVAAFNIADGKEIWRTPREDVPTWSTPTVSTQGDRNQVIVNGWKHIGGYDLGTGKELWKLSGGGDIPVPTPVVAHDLVFIANAHGRLAPLHAIRLDATGDISLQGNETSNEYVAWSVPRNGAYMQTPLVYGKYIYSCRDNGGLNCYVAKTGERVYRQRLGSGRTGFTASPVACDGKLYFTGENGEVYIVQAGPEIKLLATNSMTEVCMATPAISEGMLFIRTQHHLVAVTEE